jgi:hypothetical protein
MSTEDFDLKALYLALDVQRQMRGLTWAQATREINSVGPIPQLHPIATSTITGLRTKDVAEGAGVLQMLRWLGRAPESFMGGLLRCSRLRACRPGTHGTCCGSTRRSSMKRSTHSAAFARDVAVETGVPESHLRGLKKGGRTGFPE